MDKIWYYMKSDTTKYGPYSEEELTALIRQGILTGSDYIWMTDLTEWIKVADSIYAMYLPADDPEIAGIL
jgi:hypothetical protein